jgi:hypothetical protein
MEIWILLVLAVRVPVYKNISLIREHKHCNKQGNSYRKNEVHGNKAKINYKSAWNLNDT